MTILLLIAAILLGLILLPAYLVAHALSGWGPEIELVASVAFWALIIYLGCTSSGGVKL